MNTEKNDSNTAPKWLWVMLGVGFVMLVGAILWASAPRHPQTSVDATQYAPPLAANSGPVTETPRIVAPPTDILVGNQQSQPRVTITPLTTPKPSKRSGMHGKPVRRAGSSVPDMFPVGHIIPPASVLEAPRPIRKESKPEQIEAFPEFAYEGTQWAFTHTFADAAKIVVTPTGFELGGRSVFSLSDSTGKLIALFVQSSQNPSMYAIYR